MEGETKEKGGRRGRSRCNVHSVVAILGELRQKITIIYIRTRKKQNGEAEGAVSESHLIFSSRSVFEQGSESRGFVAVSLRKRNV